MRVARLRGDYMLSTGKPLTFRHWGANSGPLTFLTRTSAASFWAPFAPRAPKTSSGSPKPLVVSFERREQTEVRQKQMARGGLRSTSFKPGKSGGRPKCVSKLVVADVRALAKTYGEDAIEALVSSWETQRRRQRRALRRQSPSWTEDGGSLPSGWT